MHLWSEGKSLRRGFRSDGGNTGACENNEMHDCRAESIFAGYYSVVECFLNAVHGTGFLLTRTGAQMVTAENVNEVEPE